jgi:inner membrane protein
MDNLTHSLVGALIGQMGLKRKTGLAMPTLVIAANIPDIDAVAVLLGGHQHLAIRRGITHGPIAMVVLPLLLWGIMLWFDAWQTRRGKRPENRLPVNPKWLLALAFIGCLSHPLFDWFNSYGVRLLEPFSSQWFYGDTLFIIDVWIWALLGGGLSFSMKQEGQGAADWQRTARTAVTVTLTYIFANFAISTAAENMTDNLLRADGVVGKRVVVANPVPLAFWQREILWRNGLIYGKGRYSLFTGAQIEGLAVSHNALSWMLSDDAKRAPDIAAFLFWSRMPVVEPNGSKLLIGDQRFSNPAIAERFRVEIDVE